MDTEQLKRVDTIMQEIRRRTVTEFVDFMVRASDESTAKKIRGLHLSFLDACRRGDHPPPIRRTQCEYVYKRGVHVGTQCKVIVKSDGTLCTKHKHTSAPESATPSNPKTAVALSLDLLALSDEDDDEEDEATFDEGDDTPFDDDEDDDNDDI